MCTCYFSHSSHIQTNIFCCRKWCQMKINNCKPYRKEILWVLWCLYKLTCFVVIHGCFRNRNNIKVTCGIDVIEKNIDIHRFLRFFDHGFIKIYLNSWIVDKYFQEKIEKNNFKCYNLENIFKFQSHQQIRWKLCLECNTNITKTLT